MVCRIWQVADMRHYVDLCMAVDAAESEPSSRDVRPSVQGCQLAEMRRPVLVHTTWLRRSVGSEWYRMTTDVVKGYIT